MTQQEISCGLEYSLTPDIQECISEMLHANYSFIVTSLIHPRFRRPYLPNKIAVGGFTRSDMILSPQDWTNRIVAKVSSYLSVDSTSPIVQRRHEYYLIEELQYFRGLGVAAVMISLTSKENTNLARILQTFQKTSHFPTLIWTCVPMFCKRTLRNSEDMEENRTEVAYNETWLWWSKFHQNMNWDKRIGVVIEVSADLPSNDIIKRWLGEPVKGIVLPTHIFHNNKKGYPVLSRAHQQLVISMVERDAQVIVSGARRSNIEYYLQYLFRLWQRRPADSPMFSFARGWEDYLQTPLQPLADNLDTHTYNVFEKDPVKYNQYQNAIVKALSDLQKNLVCENNSNDIPPVNEISKDEKGQGDGLGKTESPFVVMILGAGRGPLVRATLNAAEITNTKVKIIAVEKNPGAVVVLAAQKRELWNDHDVTVVPGDMRYLNLSPKADIIVSELLGSWADNELSPECLDGAAGLLKSNGISIPCEYTSYVNPISSPRLWAAAKVACLGDSQKLEKNLETLWVVYMQNKHDIGECKEVFKFLHPTKEVKDNNGETMFDYRTLPLTDNRRKTTISWIANQDNVMHGFAGYFDCKLYANEMLSIHPSKHSPGMISWFPIFIPIKTPLRLHKGDNIKATFWRCVDSRRVWYEWLVEVNDIATPLHNVNGRSSEMLL